MQDYECLKFIKGDENYGLKYCGQIAFTELIQYINFIHFRNDKIQLCLIYEKLNKRMSINVKPSCCTNDELFCYWDEDNEKSKEFYINNCIIDNLVLSVNNEVIFVQPRKSLLDSKNISFKLPDLGIKYINIKKSKTLAKNVICTLSQHGIIYQCTLYAYHSEQLTVKLKQEYNVSIKWIDLNTTVHVTLKENDRVYLTAEYRIIDFSKDSFKTDYIIVLKRLENKICRFKPKSNRNPRKVIYPYPQLIFTHPLSKNRLNLKVLDISGSGASVQEIGEEAELFPGLIIPQAKLCFLYSLEIILDCQILHYDKIHDDDNVKHIIGITFLNINKKDQTKLSSILHRTEDQNIEINNKVNTSELFNLLFKSGFIYPYKYQRMNETLSKLKEIYDIFNVKDSNIVRHFIFRDDDNKMASHVSMLQQFNQSWIVHHLAATKVNNKNTGAKVLEHISKYINETHNNYLHNIQYLFSYYRPGNSHINNFFEGTATYLHDSKKASLDSFACLTFMPYNHVKLINSLPDNWFIEEINEKHQLELYYFYNKESDGLFLDAFEINNEIPLSQEIINEYKKVGINREKFIFALRYKNQTKAIFLLNVSDPNLNLSFLTNSINIVILDTAFLSQKTLYSALYYMSQFFYDKHIKILIFPYTAANELNLSIETYYNLWIFNTDYIDEYLNFFNKYKNS